MTPGWGFNLHPLAAQDIDDIWAHIADDNVRAARRVREEILAAIHALIPFPRVGHRRTDLTSRPLRFIVVREYLIAYAPEEDPLWVSATIRVRVIHMASLDWSQCPTVESVADRRSGAWVFKDTRMPVATVFENLEAGSSIEEIIEQFHVTREQIQSVLEFAARSLDAPAVPFEFASMSDAHSV